MIGIAEVEGFDGLRRQLEGKTSVFLSLVVGMVHSRVLS